MKRSSVRRSLLLWNKWPHIYIPFAAVLVKICRLVIYLALFGSTCTPRGKSHCKNQYKVTLWWNISILMGVVCSRITISPCIKEWCSCTVPETYRIYTKVHSNCSWGSPTPYWCIVRLFPPPPFYFNLSVCVCTKGLPDGWLWTEQCREGNLTSSISINHGFLRREQVSIKCSFALYLSPLPLALPFSLNYSV